ncbi:hypothetical protein AAK967_01700 [Atopobiaceae bacterium 24-176]
MIRKIAPAPDAPQTRIAVRSAAAAYLVIAGAAMGFVIYLPVCSAVWTSGQPGGFSAPM